MIYLFANIDELPDSFIETCSSFLPKWRVDQMMSYHYSLDRKLCAVAYLLLVYGLQKEGLFVDLPQFQYGNNTKSDYKSGEKPSLINYPGVYFNLSHCAGAAVCAISNKAIGIDIERVEEYDDDLAKLVCDEHEYKWVNKYSDKKQSNLTEIWTRKESVVKLNGSGLTDDLRTIPIDGCCVEYWTEGNNKYIISIIQKS